LAGDFVAMVNTANFIVRLLLSPECPACHQPLARPLTSAICDRCWRDIAPVDPPLCARCGDHLELQVEGEALCDRCLTRPLSFSVARSAGAYDGALREIVHAFKFDRRRLLAEPLARLMCREGLKVLGGADAVVPVPLHAVRSFRRGFNQADDLAREIGLPVWRLLRRQRAGRPQASLPASRRAKNLRDAFALSYRMRFGRQGLDCRGKTLVLIDDVMTTGATLDECAKVLLGAGASDVRALTVARAVESRPQRQLR